MVGVWGTKALEGVQEVDLGFEVPLDRMAQRVGQAGFKDTQSTQIPASRAVQQADGESEEENFKPAEACLLVKVTGLVSSASWGMGRSSADRQYFYINGRPVDAKPLQKALNEVYKSFNTHQVPLAVLDFRIPTGMWYTCLSLMREADFQTRLISMSHRTSVPSSCTRSRICSLRSEKPSKASLRLRGTALQ